jgi:hypothetical protein
LGWTHLHTSHLLLARPLNHLLSFSRRSIVPSLAQHLPTLRRQLLEATEILPNSALLFRRQ